MSDQKKTKNYNTGFRVYEPDVYSSFVKMCRGSFSNPSREINIMIKKIVSEGVIPSEMGKA